METMMSEKYSRVFFESNLQLVEKVKRQVADEKYEGAMQTLHSIKGAALIMSAAELIEAVSNAERAIESRDVSGFENYLEVVLECLAPFK